jgi:hypothetical protein
VKHLAVAFLLLGVSVWAQDAPPTTLQDVDAEPAEAPPQPEYGGPAILTRGGTPSVSRSARLASLRPFITLNGIYDNGLSGTIDPLGRLSSAYGVESTFGLSARHEWQQSSLALDYRGAFRQYSQSTHYGGMDNNLQLSYQRQFSPRLSLLVDESASRSQHPFALPFSTYYNSGMYNYDPTYSGLTVNELVDTPTTVLMSRARMVYQRSARLSASFAGSGFVVRRETKGLVGTSGYMASSDVAYRLSRYQTISLDYSFSHFDFQNIFGQSDMHGVGISYAVRLGRRWEASVAAGGMRIESVSIGQVALDPQVALLLGRGFGLSKLYFVNYLPRLGAHLTRSFRYASLSLGYDRGVLPGNDVFRTSASEAANTGFSYFGLHRWRFDAGLGYTRYSALTQTLGRYHNYFGTANVAYQLGKGLSAVGRVDGRRYDIHTSDLNRTYYRAQLGVAWSPGDYPLALW